MRSNFANSGKLVRFMLRRERVTSAIWIIVVALFSAGLAPAMDQMFSEPGARQQFGESINNPVMVAMMGPTYGIENYTAGAMYANMMLLWIIIAVAIMNIFLVVRHTRADEEYGRVEVIRSAPTGRLAVVNAAMVTAAIVNIILAIALGVALGVVGVESMGFAASMLFGFVVGIAGFVFAGIAAIFAQLASNRSGATGFSFLALGLFYMIRAAGDMQGNDVLACISPLGLAHRSQVYVENNLWPFIILLVEAIGCAVAAYALNAIRDLDQGFIPARPGRSVAAKSLLSPFGLAARILRNMTIIWIIVMFVLAASYGSVIADIPTFVGDSPEYLQVIGIPEQIVNTMTDADKAKIIVDYFGVFVISMMTLVALVPVINTALKIRVEEREGRTEQVYAAAVPRMKYLLGYVILAFVLSILIQFASAAGLYSATSVLEANPFTFDGLLQAFFVYLPAMWVIIGFTVLIVGLFPKTTGAVWGLFGFVFLVSFLGGMPGLLPEWLQNVSPVKHIPQLPLAEMTFTPLIILTVIALVLTVAGFFFYKNRDSVTA
ncbi:MAG: hypothetical protein FWG47_03885 [Propionibacteriaceae bacterium]|nr:hypothetical protein [Propionibacteriaceae bacterium]